MAGSNGVAVLRRARRAASSFAGASSNGHGIDSTETWWDLDREILAAMGDRPVSPATMALRLGLSESTITSLLCMLITEGKIRISAVERADIGMEEHRQR